MTLIFTLPLIKTTDTSIYYEKTTDTFSFADTFLLYTTNFCLQRGKFFSPTGKKYFPRSGKKRGESGASGHRPVEARCEVGARC